jgi:aryl-alcohol dehydrogenase-like predicted oxidoreductase
MKYRKLGRTGLMVSEISLGSWLTYGDVTEKETAIKSIDAAYDLGINFFDTANVYARGASEVVVGEALRKYPRESYVLATKVFWPMGDGPNDRGLSRKHIFEQAHASLKRLKHDYVDVYYCHRYDPNTPIDETLRTIEDLVRQGKVMYVGVSEWTAAQIQEAIGTADKYLLDRIVVNQPEYSMLKRKIESEIIPVSQENGISQVVFSPLAQGVLTGKYRSKGKIPADSRANDPKANMFIGQFMNEEVLSKVERLDALAKEADMKLSHMAIAWILRQDNLASALVGASRPEQVIENAKASGIVLPEDLLGRIDAILA